MVITHRLSTMLAADQILALDRATRSRGARTPSCWRLAARTPSCIDGTSSPRSRPGPASA